MRIIPAVVAALLLASCGGAADDDSSTASRDDPPSTSAPTTPPESESTSDPDGAVERISIEVTDATLGPLTFDALAAGDPAAAGDGRLVLLLHGFPESSESYREILPRLAAEGWYAVAPDQRGYSPGARPEAVESYVITNLVADALGMADALGAETFHLVGHDWGGGVAWVAAGLAPDRVASLVSLSTPHPDAIADAFADPNGEQAAMSGYMNVFRQEDSELGLLADGPSTFVNIFSASGLPREKAEVYADLLGTPEVLRLALHWYRANPVPAGIRLGPVTVPTMFVWGADDSALGRTSAEATATYVSGAYRFEELADHGHWLPEEDPDGIADLLVAHLADQS